MDATRNDLRVICLRLRRLHEQLVGMTVKIERLEAAAGISPAVPPQGDSSAPPEHALWPEGHQAAR